MAGTTTTYAPERGAIPNPKHRLEDYVYLRVCRRHLMLVRTARLIFLGDWVASYLKYHPT